MVFAQLKNGTIQNTILIDDLSVLSLFSSDPQTGESYDSVVRIDTVYPQPGISWTFDGITWSAPPDLTPAPDKIAVEMYTDLVRAAMSFGQQLITQFAVANVMGGITQSGKTQALLNYTGNLYICLSTGSLYAAIDEINLIMADTSETKATLSPFITDDILVSYRQQIQVFLGIPLT